MTPPVPYGIKRPATLCILRSGGRLLLLQRAKEPHVDKLTPLGGKIDPHERPHDAAVREVGEEAGITLETMAFAGIFTETSPVNYNWINYVYTAEVAAFDPPPCDEGLLRWVPFNYLRKFRTPETDVHLYNYIARGQPFAFDAVFDAEIRLIRMVDELSGRVLVDHR